MTASYHKYTLNFELPGGTSRGVLTQKETWFIILNKNGKRGIGECGIFRGLSVDDVPDYEDTLKWVCENIQLEYDELYKALNDFPSIQFGLEMAFRSLESRSEFELFPSGFSEGKAAIPINGLIWMGDESFMQEQIASKIDSGFDCLKMKIGAIDFERELDILFEIRRSFKADEIELA